VTAATRDTTSWLGFLDHLEAFVPTGEVYLIVDALPLHWTVDTMLWTWGHARFHFVPLPKAAAWLNLIEGSWKILTQRSLHGRACPDTRTVAAALQAGVDEWNRQPTPVLWGRPPRPKRRFRRTYTFRI
jgi:transposase